MKKSFLILISGLLLVGFNSCNWFNPKVHCKDFDVKLLEWTPYKANDTINFIDTLNNKYKLIVQRTWLEHKASYSKRTKCECGDQWGIQISGKSDSLKTKASFENYDPNNPSEDYLIETYSKKSEFISHNSKIEYLDSMEIKGHFFKNVKILRCLNDNDIKIIMSRNLGFIMINFNDLKLFNQKFVPIVCVTLNSFNYTETNCN